MPSEQNKWEIERLKEKEKEEKRLREEHEKRLRELERFRIETVERLKTLFNKIKDIESSNQFVSKTFFTVILGGLVTAVGALLKWLMG